MPSITTAPATPERWDDLQHALTGGGDGGGCQCAWFTLTNKEWNATRADDRRALLREELERSPAPGVIAYVDGEAAGWVRVGPRTRQVRLARTRALLAVTTEPLDDEGVWAITCVAIRRDHRGRGLVRTLIAAAVEHARAGGARLVEGYPIDTGGRQRRSNDLYHGTLAAFLAAGFAERARMKPDRPLVALPLSA